MWSIVFFLYIFVFVEYIFIPCNSEEFTSISTHSLLTTRLQHVLTLPTLGSAGFTYFTQDLKSFLVSANFWDGKDTSMGAYSTLFQLQFHRKQSQTNDMVVHDVSFEMKQRFYGRGAHGVEVVDIPNTSESPSKRYLMFPNYYQCNTESNTQHCASLFIYQYHELKQQFVIFHKLMTSGPSQTTSFTSHGFTYLVVAENFASFLSLYQFTATSLTLLNQVEVAGIAAVAAITLSSSSQEEIHIFSASYYDDGFSQTRSKVFRFNPQTKSFEQLQVLLTNGAHDVEAINYHGQTFVHFSEDKDNNGPRIRSQVRLSK